MQLLDFAKLNKARSVFCEPSDPQQFQEGEILEVSDDDSELEVLDDIVRDADN